MNRVECLVCFFNGFIKVIFNILLLSLSVLHGCSQLKKTITCTHQLLQTSLLDNRLDFFSVSPVTLIAQLVKPLAVLNCRLPFTFSYFLEFLKLVLSVILFFFDHFLMAFHVLIVSALF